jgi:hypothetical protein
MRQHTEYKTSNSFTSNSRHVFLKESSDLYLMDRPVHAKRTSLRWVTYFGATSRTHIWTNTLHFVAGAVESKSNQYEIWRHVTVHRSHLKYVAIVDPTKCVYRDSISTLMTTENCKEILNLESSGSAISEFNSLYVNTCRGRSFTL